ncbi:hypothetical protein [Candidatus Leptofilum sp.]|uniref:hypothetical protein n=1 Tax=Candidatus Leptofilum sp. TaxID=3241576 RepID=UPI003B5B0D7D
MPPLYEQNARFTLQNHLGTIWLRKLIKVVTMSGNEGEKKKVSNWAVNNKAFLVRLWRDSETAPWRTSITHVQTKETQTFSTVPALFLYLHEQISKQ